MNEIKIFLSYILFAIIGLGIIIFGLIASILRWYVIALISFVIGISICISAFFAARKLID